VPYEVVFQVEAFEDVSVSAGNFKAFRVVATDTFGKVGTPWWVPAQGSLLLKRTVLRPATRPQGAGQVEAQLLSKDTLKQRSAAGLERPLPRPPVGAAFSA